jgi:FMN phosphatase YigB (HAD superfamily)
MKKILTDCDGVLLDWETSFHYWMKDKGYSKVVHGTYDLGVAYDLPKDNKYELVREFNDSAWMCCLPVLRDACSGVARLFEAGYRFDVITSLSLDPFAKKLRWMNLDNHFGRNAFNDLICLDTGADKDDALAEYKDSGLWWIEDKPENCDAGLRAGLRPILIDHLHNRDYNHPDVIRVRNWKELCEVILGE